MFSSSYLFKNNGNVIYEIVDSQITFSKHEPISARDTKIGDTVVELGLYKGKMAFEIGFEGHQTETVELENLYNALYEATKQSGYQIEIALKTNSEDDYFPILVTSDIGKLFNSLSHSERENEIVALTMFLYN